jgi:hypothetical protein
MVPPQSSVPNGHWQTPLLHVEPAAHVLPQLPQFSVVPFGCGTPTLQSTQVPLQLCVPLEQHLPRSHDWPLVHAKSHAPQLFGSLCQFVQNGGSPHLFGLTPPVAVAQSWHAPLMQLACAAHTSQAAPQWPSSVCVSAQTAGTHELAGYGQFVVHEPLMHVSFDAHGLPHAPQFASSSSVLVQVGGVPHTVLPGVVAGLSQHSPPMFTSGSLQQTPLWHVWPAPQA